MITHTSDSHQIWNQNKRKSKLQIKKEKKIANNSNFGILQETLHATNLLKLLGKMYKYEMDPTRTVGATEQTCDAGRTDGQTDGRTDGQTKWNQYTPQQLCCVGGKISSANWPLEFGIGRPYKCVGNHTYWGPKNNWGMQSKNGLQNLWGNIVFFILC